MIDQQYLRVPARFNFTAHPPPRPSPHPSDTASFKMAVSSHCPPTHLEREKNPCFEGRRQNSRFSSFKSVGHDPNKKLTKIKPEKPHQSGLPITTFQSPAIAYDNRSVGPNSMVEQCYYDDCFQQAFKDNNQSLWGSYTRETEFFPYKVDEGLDRSGRWITDSGYSSNLSPDGQKSMERPYPSRVRDELCQDFDTLAMHGHDLRVRVAGRNRKNTSTISSMLGSKLKISNLTSPSLNGQQSNNGSSIRTSWAVSKNDIERIELFYRGYKTRVMHVGNGPVEFYAFKEEKSDDSNEGKGKWVYKFTGIPLLLISSGHRGATLGLRRKGKNHWFSAKESHNHNKASQISMGENSPNKAKINNYNSCLASNFSSFDSHNPISSKRVTQSSYDASLSCSDTTEDTGSNQSEDLRSIISKSIMNGPTKQIIPSPLWAQTLDSCKSYGGKRRIESKPLPISLSLVIAEMGTGFLLWKADILKQGNPPTSSYDTCYLSGIEKYEEVRNGPKNNFHVLTRRKGTGSDEDKTTSKVSLKFKDGGSSQDFAVALESCLTSIKDDRRENTGETKWGNTYKDGSLDDKKIPKIPLKNTISAPCQFQHVTQLSLKDAGKFYTLSHLVDGGDMRFR